MKEMVGGCCVCSDDRGWPENPLVYCDGQSCTVAVHQGKSKKRGYNSLFSYTFCFFHITDKTILNYKCNIILLRMNVKSKQIFLMLIFCEKCYAAFVVIKTIYMYIGIYTV